jgi:hypothetical protein
MALTRDDWVEAQNRLVAEGWVITGAARYDPTTITGTTPSGKVFTFAWANGSGVLEIAGRTKSTSRASWESGADTESALRAAYGSFPKAQQ